MSQLSYTFGVETEYATIWIPKEGSRTVDPDFLSRMLFSRVRAWGGSNDIFLPNGGRLYIDTGAHPEYSTPEVSNLYDLVAHSRAGDMVIRQLGRSTENLLWSRYDLAGRLAILRNNVDESGASWGCHENILVRRSVSLNDLVRQLAPFLATRIIWAGAGGFIPAADGKYRYVYSPRSKHIVELTGTDTSSRRPLINLRDESHAGPGYRRLHILAGDTNIVDVANFVKVGVLATLCRMMEDGAPLPDLDMTDHLAVLHHVNVDLESKARYDAGSSRYSAIEIQQMYFEAISSWLARGGELPEDGVTAVRMLGGLLEALHRKDWAFLLGRVDWVRKKYLVDTLAKSQHFTYQKAEARFVDYTYHAIDRHFDTYRRLQKFIPSVELADRSDVVSAYTNPPPGRATARGRFVTDVLIGQRNAHIDWERWGYEQDPLMIQILDPTSDDPGTPVAQIPSLWESKSAVRARPRFKKS